MVHPLHDWNNEDRHSYICLIAFAINALVGFICIIILIADKVFAGEISDTTMKVTTMLGYLSILGITFGIWLIVNIMYCFYKLVEAYCHCDCTQSSAPPAAPEYNA